ncbi:MAG: gliding motility-associated C-terminal domain-containing protein [Bacteroidia bacterium]
MRTYLLIILSLIISSVIAEGGATIKFKENKNQWPSNVRFMGELTNGKVFLERGSFVYEFIDPKMLSTALEKRNNKKNGDSDYLLNGHVYRTTFLNSHSSILAESQQPEYYNYFLGKEPSNWATEVSAYKKIIYKNLYEGIDMHVYSEASNFKYDIILSPNSDPSKIQLKFENIDGISLTAGNLEIKTNAGYIIEKAPIAWQLINNKKIMIEAAYHLDGRIVSFEFPKGYNKKYELVIDPIVIACTFTGSTAYCGGEASTYDKSGSIYLTGYASSPAFPVSMGAFQTTLAGSNDVTIHKFNSDGSSLIFASFFGGSSTEGTFCTELVNNELIVAGRTKSPNLPITAGSYDTSYNGSYDLFIAKFDTSGNSLIASTYIGGSSDEGMPGGFAANRLRNYEFVHDNTGNIFLTSCTMSPDFPVSSNAYSSVLKGTYDAVVFKMDFSLTTLLWSTYLGGSSKDCANSIRLDLNGGVYCFGSTESTDFPVTSGTISQTKDYGPDCFVTHLNSTGSSITASTYIGTNGSDYSYVFTLDDNQDLILYSILWGSPSATFNPTPGTYSMANSTNLIQKIDSSLSSFIFKASIGSGQFYFDPSAIAVDSCGNIYLAGCADASLPTTPNAFKATTQDLDLYFCIFNNTASSLIFASYYGGSGSEFNNWGINRFDKSGTLYMSFGGTNTTPVTASAFSSSNCSPSGPYSTDHGLIKIDFQTFLNAVSYTGPKNGCAPYNQIFINASNTGSVQWTFGDGSASVFTDSTSHLYSSPGIYNSMLIISDTSTCNKVDTLVTQINVLPPPFVDLGPDQTICSGTSTSLVAGNPGSSYMWSTGSTQSILNVSDSGSYSIVVGNIACFDQDTVQVSISPSDKPIIFPNIITPNGDNLNDKLTLTSFPFTESEIDIFDRWGKSVFKSDSLNASWNGYVNSTVIEGTYFWTLRYKTDCLPEWVKKSGFITVIK